MKEAMYYKRIDENSVQCELCPHLCKLKDNRVGICNVRKNIGGKLFSLVYSKAIALHVDPIEKKPIFHVAPGTKSLSMATVGCNFQCKFCQNHDISQVDPRQNLENVGQDISPDKIVELALKNSCESISYTYTEPTIYYEYAFDTMRIACEKGLINIFVTNGYINPEPLKNASQFLHAANVDLKSMRDNFYQRFINAKLTPVLETLKLMKKLNIWLEITTLLIPNENDSIQELTQIAKFIVNELGPETPWHISRFYPQFKLLDHPPTSIASLERAHDIGISEGLRYVYLGNTPGNDADNTFCYNCKKMLIKRLGYKIFENNVTSGECKYCHTKIDGLL